MKTRSEKKGFATAVFAALVVLALSFLTFALFTLNTGYQNAQLEARIVNERFEDARDFFNETHEDAIVDAAYAVYGCAPSASDFCAEYDTRFQEYLSKSMAVFPDASFSQDSSQQPSCSLSAQSPPTHFEFNVSFPAVLEVQKNNALKQGLVGLVKHVSIDKPKKSGEVFRVQTGEHDFSYACP